MFSPPVGPNAGLKNNAQQQQQPNQSMEFGFKPGTVLLTLTNIVRKGPTLIRIRSLRSLLKNLTKPYIKVKSRDLSIMHDHVVMRRRKLSYNWLNTHVIK